MFTAGIGDGHAILGHMTELPEQFMGGSRQVLIAGQNRLAVRVTKQLARAGVQSFFLLSSMEDHSENSQDTLIRAARSSGGASIRLIQVSGYDSPDFLLPEETDLLVDCSTGRKDHAPQEKACRAQGVPLVLAYEDDEKLLTGLADPYAGSLALLFSEEKVWPQALADERTGLAGDADTEAAGAVCRLAMETLTGQARFFRSKVHLFDRAARILSTGEMPCSIPSYDRMVLVGSDHRDLGKTSLCAALARDLVRRGRSVCALKIEASAREEDPLILEESTAVKKPQVRALFESGCQRIVRLVASETGIRQVLPDLLEHLYAGMDPAGLLLCESNTARQLLQPACFVHLASPDGRVKPSAIRTRRLADRLLPWPFTNREVDDLIDAFDRLLF